MPYLTPCSVVSFNLGAVLCALHKNPTPFALRSTAIGLVMYGLFTASCFNRGFEPLAIAFWAALDFAFAAYFFCVKCHPASAAAAAAAKSKASSARSPGRSPKRGRKST